jgi:hypothetical protein
MTEIPTPRRGPKRLTSAIARKGARILREPLCHFLFAGGLIFLLYSAVAEPGLRPGNEIIVEPANIESLVSGFRRVWLREPSETEKMALIDEFVRDEIYYREALALGLDRDDVVVRRRLRQKMEFLLDTGADLLEPTESELQAYLDENMQSYRQAPRMAFEQVFLGANPPADRIESALRELRSSASADPEKWSEPTLLPPQVSSSPPDTVDGLFGDGFFDQLSVVDSDAWAGPVSSSYGVHLVRVSKREPAVFPPLEQVRDRVVRDWKAAKTKELRELHYARLRKQYDVEIRGSDRDRLRERGR